ncbi:MAG: hypothetical protein V4513_01825 [Pseudomonadota bacterium]
MPGRRRVQKGSFGSHFDELVNLFPDHQPQPSEPPAQRSRELQEKLDIHALLFERAWRLNGPNGGSAA